jgi:hypothetical protein
MVHLFHQPCALSRLRWKIENVEYNSKRRTFELADGRGRVSYWPRAETPDLAEHFRLLGVTGTIWVRSLLGAFTPCGSHVCVSARPPTRISLTLKHFPNVVAGHGRCGERAAIAKERDDVRKKVDAANRVRHGAAEALIMRG